MSHRHEPHRFQDEHIKVTKPDEAIVRFHGTLLINRETGVITFEDNFFTQILKLTLPEFIMMDDPRITAHAETWGIEDGSK